MAIKKIKEDVERGRAALARKLFGNVFRRDAPWSTRIGGGEVCEGLLG